MARSPPRIPGHTVELLGSVPSTNALARARVEAGTAPAGLVLAADAQTAGRGRHGRTWHTVPRRSLAVSLVLAPPPLPRPSLVTLLGAVAACRALEGLGAPELGIKWPNDLMRGERKLGGVLGEHARTPDGESLLVLGLGVNLELRPGDLPPAVAALATDAGLGADRHTRDALLRAFVRTVDELLAAVPAGGVGSWGEEYRRRSWLTGRQVDLAWQGRHERVRVADVTAEGDLVLGDGRVIRGESAQLVGVVASAGSPP